YKERNVSMAVLLMSLLLVATTGVHASQSNWSPKNCPTDPRPVALELIELELAGAALLKPNQCIDQSKFQYIEAVPERYSEMEPTIDQILPDSAKVSITKMIQVHNDDPELFRVEFQIEVPGRKGSSQIFKDSLM